LNGLRRFDNVAGSRTYFLATASRWFPPPIHQGSVFAMGVATRWCSATVVSYRAYKGVKWFSQWRNPDRLAAISRLSAEISPRTDTSFGGRGDLQLVSVAIWTAVVIRSWNVEPE
jgi:hypothetical protein